MKTLANIAFAGLLVLGTAGLSFAADEARMKSGGALSKNDNAWIYDHDIACRYNQGDRAVVLTRGSHYGWLKVGLLKNGRVDCLGYGPESNMTIRRNAIRGQRIHTYERWDQHIPVFKNRDAFFSARNHQDKHGWYKSNDRICWLFIGDEVIFKQYRNWGVGEVWVIGKHCSGWMAAGVAR